MKVTIPFFWCIRRVPNGQVGFALISLVVSAFFVVMAQQPPIQPAASNAQVDRDEDESIDGQTSPVAEMMAKRRIKLEEKEHQETVDRATEASKLGNELVETFQKTQKLAQQDFRKIDRIEKLAKKIRDAFGGSGEDLEIENTPHDVSAALLKLRELSSDLHDRIGKTSRMEISAAVIERTNELLEVIKILRLMRATNT
ncbi:MAG: hypothetical protein QOH96_190 [Blastocatellia bacterium]|jgi:hypothetical protein|nr:hypothetical protein [Blastocatellia bacterium]